MISLFRSEAIAHQQQRLYGTILLARPLSFTVLTWLFSVIAISLVAFFFLFGFSRKEVVPGVLLPEHGLVRVFARQPGVIVDRLVGDGEIVRKGDILFVLSGERSSSTVGDTQSAIGATLNGRISRLKSELNLQQQQSHQLGATLEKRRAALQEQLVQLETDIELQNRRTQLTEAAAKRFVDLHDAKFVSQAQSQEKAADALEQQSKLRTLERGRSALKLELITLDAELRDHPLKSKREASSLERGISELQQDMFENEAQRQLVVRAPYDGRIAALIVEPGQAVGANQALATVLILDDKLEAELYAPTRSIGFVKPGTKVILRYQAFPYQKFGQHEGVVREVSHSALRPEEVAPLLSRNTSSSEPLYRIRVAIGDQFVTAYGKNEPLQVGMQLEGSLVLEKRKLYEWVIDPLISLTGRL